MADFDSVIHLSVARDRAQRRKQLKVGNTGTSGYRAPEVRIVTSILCVYMHVFYMPVNTTLEQFECVE